MTRHRLMLYTMALGSVTLWGASFPLTKVAMAEIGPTSLAFLRWAISAVVLCAWLAAGAARGARRVLGITPAAAAAPQTGLALLVKQHGLTIAWVALTGVTLFYYLENMAMRYTGDQCLSPLELHVGIHRAHQRFCCASGWPCWNGSRWAWPLWVRCWSAWVPASCPSAGRACGDVDGRGQLLRRDLTASGKRSLGTA